MTEFNELERKLLLNLAKESIKFGLDHNRCMDANQVDLYQYSKHLKENRACFVTLHLKGMLKGCIGSLVVYRPLFEDVIYNAFAAAFQDPRFIPLVKNEFNLLDLEISVLSKPEKLEFTSEKNLLSKIRPKIDGLILSSGLNKGTFLPTVWDELPEPITFLNHLKMKAGLSSDYWSDDIVVERYTTELII